MPLHIVPSTVYLRIGWKKLLGFWLSRSGANLFRVLAQLNQSVGGQDSERKHQPNRLTVRLISQKSVSRSPDQEVAVFMSTRYR